ANSQFFICFDDARFLDGQYTVWGEVTEGMELIDALPKGEPPANPGKIVTMKAQYGGSRCEAHRRGGIAIRAPPVARMLRMLRPRTC
ncbi:peptidylprolyl isomerase, partial [Salmonella enterica]|uniref:peptidylprolyl isomerase n=1 Tax=Salmonella enterica TaxID=28901 RepID=UPI0022B680B1